MEESYKKQELESLRRKYKKERSLLRHGILFTTVCAGIATYGIMKNEGLIATVASFPAVALGVTTYFIGGGVVELRKKIRALESELTDK